MRSFAGRDILSLKGFERNEFMHLFEIADRLVLLEHDICQALEEAARAPHRAELLLETRAGGFCVLGRAPGELVPPFVEVNLQVIRDQHPPRERVVLDLVAAERGR